MDPTTYATALTSLKSAAEISKMSAAEAKTYAKDLTANFSNLLESLFKPESGIIAQLQSQLNVSQKVNQTLLDQLQRVERETASNAQYSRRETLEFHGIPSSFDDGRGLEANIVQLIKDFAPAANVSADDLHAVHRLKKKENVIVKFTNRKKSHAVITKRKALDATVKQKHKLDNVFVNESMCYQYKKLYYLCKQLKNNGKLAYYTFFNGSIRVKLGSEEESRVIGHVSDLMKITKMTRNEIENLG